MDVLDLKYGCNPNQKPARVLVKEGTLPIRILNGAAGYINLLDALNGWQLVSELKKATGLASAASFKHVSPAGAAVALPMSDSVRAAYFVKEDHLSDIATAYIRARGTDRMSSYGDFVSLSDECDAQTARILSTEVSDGIIAPSYSAEALEILRKKRKGNYLVIQMDPGYRPEALETKQIFGITFEQGRNDIVLSDAVLQTIPTKNKVLPDNARLDLLIALITLKYTQSNSVCYVKDGQTIGVGAGQQSRIHCTRLAGNKADIWLLRQHPKALGLPFKAGAKQVDKDNAIDIYLSDNPMELLADGAWEALFTEKPGGITQEEKHMFLSGQTGVSLGSDAFFPFGDNIERARRSGVSYVAQTGGSIRDDHVIETCDKYGIVMAFTGVRLFHH